MIGSHERSLSTFAGDDTISMRTATVINNQQPGNRKAKVLRGL